MDIKTVRVRLPEGANVIIGQAHFIKTIEDLYEAVITASPGAKFGAAFNEASGPCLVRAEGNDEELKGSAIANAEAIGAGHVFVIVLRGAFPISVLNSIKACPEVCTIYCATANAVEVLVASSHSGRGVIGVIDGRGPRGVEGEREKEERKGFLRNIGYKL